MIDINAFITKTEVASAFILIAFAAYQENEENLTRD
jgi:hypothetical protein